MSEKKQITIRLTTLILIVILIIVAIVVAVKVIKKDNKVEENNEIKQQNVNSNETPEEIPNTNIDELADFELSFLKMENNKENMVYSPLSIKYALNMLNEGAKGTTKEQIEKIIKDLDTTKYDNINNRLSLANGIYIRNEFSDYIEEDYIETLEDKYNAEVRYDTFKSAKNINSWIEDKTLGQIKNLLKDEQVTDPSMKLALINALAIDMEWESRFSAEKTHSGDFNLIDNTKMKATMMNKETKEDSASYYKDENVTALAMNLEEYEDTQLEFLAIMPTKDNLQKYIENVTMEDIDSIIDGLKSAEDEKAGINITIPKFSFDYELELEKDLRAIGITDAFDESKADFSGITEQESFCIGAALHKANIDFTEKGVKAAAVTVILMTENAAIVEKDRPEEVKIDNPFIYLIRDKETGEIWFVGTVYEPNSWEDDKADYEYR